MSRNVQITDEERQNSTYNPIYMGEETDNYGHLMTLYLRLICNCSSL